MKINVNDCGNALSFPSVRMLELTKVLLNSVELVIFLIFSGSSFFIFAHV